MARFLQESNLSYVVLEKNTSVGAFFSTYPKHRVLVSTNKQNVGEGEGDEFALRHDWHSLLHSRAGWISSPCALQCLDSKLYHSLC